MPIVDAVSGARVEEVAERIYQIHLPVPGDTFSFNQYLIDDDEPLLFHTGPRSMAAVVLRAIEHVMPLQKLRWVGYSHCENDECGAMAALLSAAPQARPVTGSVGSMLNSELFDRPTLGLKEGETLSLGHRRVAWLDAAHLPHSWECGYLFEQTTATLLCGDLFTQPGARGPAVTEADILGPSEAMRARMDYFALAPSSRLLLEKLAAARPALLAVMHGSAWRGDGGQLLLALAEALERSMKA